MENNSTHEKVQKERKDKIFPQNYVYTQYTAKYLHILSLFMLKLLDFLGFMQKNNLSFSQAFVLGQNMKRKGHLGEGGSIIF